MEIKNNAPKLLVKQKNIQLVFDYCLENKLKFNVIPRLSPDEWEVEINIIDVMSAVALGIFIRENKIDVIGLNHGTPKVQTTSAAKVVKTTAKGTKKSDLMEEASLMGLSNSNELLTENTEENPDVLSKTELAF